MHTTISIFSLLAFTGLVFAGPVSYGLCQTDCNKIATTCYTNAGLTFGTVLAKGAAKEDAPPAALRCNEALGKCAYACAVAELGDAGAGRA